MSRPRLLTRFSSVDGAVNVTFPAAQYEWESRQGLRTALEAVVGADYAIDMLENAVAPKETASERLRGLIVQPGSDDLSDEIEALRGGLHRLGRGRLWATVPDDSAGIDVWAWARLAAMPDITLTYENHRYAPFIASFLRLSDWYAETETVITEEDVNASPTVVAAPNSGTATVRNAVIELRANAASGFQSVTITNLATGDSFTSSRVAQSGNSILRVDCGRRAVEYSNDNGETWTPDYGNFAIGSRQVDFLRLTAGANNLRYTQGSGTPNLDIVVRYYAAYD